MFGSSFQEEPVYFHQENMMTKSTLQAAQGPFPDLILPPPYRSSLAVT